MRFKGFGEEWVEKRLEGLFKEFKSGTGITSAHINDDGNYPVYGGNGLRGFTDTFTHDGFYLLIGRQGALCGNINRSYGKAFISEHAIAGMANDESDTEWLAQRLRYYNLNRLSESSAQPGLSVAKLLRFKLVVPDKTEQQKIAAFLETLDKQIEAQIKIIKQLETLMSGLRQKIFSQQIRFKDDEGNDFPDWEEKRLEEIGKTYNGLTGKTKEDFGVGKRYIQYKQIFDSSSIDISKSGFVNVPENEGQTKVKLGDVFFTVSSETPEEVGMSSVLLEEVEDVYLNSFALATDPLR
ncbi:restriction endonuclease subunit S [Algoriphagus sp. Y33]|uniref:restriction endonuclease subunit S n=1 Tax=Algoriphagus sp. Y33 TaxID=2772483 RepID=UPI00178714F3|nr:restriction endonuclease subunit S [Algoriphagus sp. Y33]